MAKHNYILIGPGKISHFHYEALKNNGFNLISIIASNLKSKSLKKFLTKYQVSNKYVSDDIAIIDKNYIKSNKIKFILLTTGYNQTPKIIQRLKNLDILILTEKPVSIDIDWFETLNFNEFKNIKVAYNRRFYNNVNYLKNILTKKINNLSNLNIDIPEKIFLDGINHKNIFKKYYSNSAHIIDLLFYLFGNLEILDVDFFNKKKSKSFFVIFSFNKKSKGIIKFMFNSPMQFGISFDIDNLKYSLSPIENLSIYNRLEISNPSKKSPIRTYQPKIYKRIISDDFNTKTKPGFNKQVLELKRCIKLKNYSDNFSNLENAYKVQKFLNDIMRILFKK